MKKKVMILLPALALMVSCEKSYVPQEETEVSEVPSEATPETVARLLSCLDIGSSQMTEVHQAVKASSANGYDEEYLMKSLFSSPGSGVGDVPTKSSSLDEPLRDLISRYLENLPPTKSLVSPQEFISMLSSSDMQIYWPYSDSWDGVTQPAITFNPGNGANMNIGWEQRPDGTLAKVLIDEDYARKRPVWIVNNNEDSAYTTWEMIKKQDPSAGSGGGAITESIRPQDRFDQNSSLTLRALKVAKNFDNFFAGASELFIKCGSLSGFQGYKEEDLYRFIPMVTDFMVTVHRNQLNVEIPFEAVIVSSWTDQMEDCALLIVEEDGGTIQKWEAETTAKVNSKSYGVNVSIPLFSRDDIIWRGVVSRKYFDNYSGVWCPFGDIQLKFEIE